MGSLCCNIFLGPLFLILIISTDVHGVDQSFLKSEPGDVDFFLHAFEFLTCSLDTPIRDASIRRDGTKTHITAKSMDCAYEGVRLKFDGATYHTITYDSNYPGVMVDNRVYCSLDALRNPQEKFMKTQDGTVWYSNCPIGKAIDPRSIPITPAAQPSPQGFMPKVAGMGRQGVESGINSAGKWGKESAEATTQKLGKWSKDGVNSGASAIGGWGRQKAVSAADPLGKWGRKGANALSNTAGKWGQKGVDAATGSVGKIGKKGADAATQAVGQWGSRGGDALKSTSGSIADTISEWQPKSILKKGNKSPPRTTDQSQISQLVEESAAIEQPSTPTIQQLAQKYDLTDSPLNSLQLVKQNRQSSNPAEDKTQARPRLRPLTSSDQLLSQSRQRLTTSTPKKPNVPSKVQNFASKTPSSKRPTPQKSQESPKRPKTRPLKQEPKGTLDGQRNNAPSYQDETPESSMPSTSKRPRTSASKSRKPSGSQTSFLKNRPESSASKAGKDYKSTATSFKRRPTSSASPIESATPDMQTLPPRPPRPSRPPPPRRRKTSGGGSTTKPSKGLFAVTRTQTRRKGNAPTKRKSNTWYPRIHRKNSRGGGNRNGKNQPRKRRPN